MQAYDLIGDIHGHATELKLLLAELGYQPSQGSYRHPAGRKLIFCGDLIDRGSEIREVVQIVRAMVEAQQALIVIGNHEYNILCYHHWVDGDFLRPHSTKNAHQIHETLKAYAEHPAEWLGTLEWFKTLPLFLDLAELRVVHACWHEPSIQALKQALPDHQITPAFLYHSSQKSRPEYEWVEAVLKGLEVDLPEPHFFRDKDGHARRTTRVRWWPTAGQSWQEIAMGLPMDHDLSQQNFSGSLPDSYPADQKPVFFGHYWMRGTPTILTENICCLDWSIAKSGRLAAYRWQGESQLSDQNWVSVASI